MTEYEKMWNDFAKAKADSYIKYKFKPTHRVGLTNFLREELIFEFLNAQSNDIVLDAGCASGKQLFFLAPKIKEGYGTDIAGEFIDRANKEKNDLGVKNIFFNTAEVERLPFEDEKFDKIICGEVLEHVFDKDKAITELSRVLKQGGMLVISVPNLNADGTLWGRFLRLTGKKKFIPLENFSTQEIIKHGDAHVREFSSKGIREWLEKNNFFSKEIRSVSFIDGPKFDFLLKFPLHVSPLRGALIQLEKFLTFTRLPFGRHLVVWAVKA